jgi:Ca2+-binding EF-hand superfamily protein
MEENQQRLDEPEAQRSSSAAESVSMEEKQQRLDDLQTLNVMGALRSALKAGRSLHGKKVTDVATLFAVIDKDGKGSIVKAELEDGLKRMGMGLSDKQLQVVMKVVDADGNESINFEEFVAAIGPDQPGVDQEAYAAAMEAAGRERVAELTELRGRAQSQGINEDEIAAAESSDDPKAAFLQLIAKNKCVALLAITACGLPSPCAG